MTKFSIILFASLSSAFWKSVRQFLVFVGFFAGMILLCAHSALAFDAADLERLLRTNACEDCNLFKANLANKNLSGADLSGANLSGANLQGADLSNAVILEAILQGADLRKAKLDHTQFQGSNLSGADMRGATTTWADMTGASLTNAKLMNAFGRPKTWFTQVEGIDITKAPGLMCSNCGNEPKKNPVRYCLNPKKDPMQYNSISWDCKQRTDWMWTYGP